MADKPSEKPQEQPKPQKPPPPVEIDPLLGDFIQKGDRPTKETKQK